MKLTIGDISCDVSVVAAVSKPQSFGADGRCLNPAGYEVRWWTVNQGGAQEMPPARFFYKIPPPWPNTVERKSIDEDQRETEESARNLYIEICRAKGWL